MSDYFVGDNELLDEDRDKIILQKYPTFLDWISQGNAMNQSELEPQAVIEMTRIKVPFVSKNPRFQWNLIALLLH